MIMFLLTATVMKVLLCTTERVTPNMKNLMVLLSLISVVSLLSAVTFYFKSAKMVETKKLFGLTIFLAIAVSGVFYVIKSNVKNGIPIIISLCVLVLAVSANALKNFPTAEDVKEAASTAKAAVKY